MQLGELRSFRRLAPAYALGNHVFCWECTLCRKLFMHQPYDSPPTEDQLRAIAAEFEHHDCTIQLVKARDKARRVLSVG
jgi:hypothetical protein